jgi:hypothetical protein
MLWHQKNADTRGPDISIPLIYLVSAFFWQHSSGWEEVGVGHKSVRQLYFIKDEMDAVDVYNRLRSHLLIIEYPLKLNPAFRPCDPVVLILAL